jgi:hypothetical protein
MRKQTKWMDEYRGVTYEVTYWGEDVMNDGAGMWNYYIVIPEPQLSSEDWQKVWLDPVRFMDRSSGYKEPIYDEHNSILKHGDFHGGITFYQKLQDVDTDPPRRSIKVGCDYGHLFDKEYGYPYDMEWVARDARITIDRLCEVLTFKRRCGWNGRYFFGEEGVWDPASQRLISPDGWEQKQKWLEKKGCSMTDDHDEPSIANMVPEPWFILSIYEEIEFNKGNNLRRESTGYWFCWLQHREGGKAISAREPTPELAIKSAYEAVVETWGATMIDETEAWAWLARRYDLSPDNASSDVIDALECAADDIRLLRDELRTVATGHREHGTRSTAPEEGMELVYKFDMMPKGE